MSLKSGYLVIVFLVLGVSIPEAHAFKNPRVYVESIPQGLRWLKGRSSGQDISSVAPAEFVKAAGGRWIQRRGGPNGDFRRIWGTGIAVDPKSVDRPALAEKAAKEFWKKNAALLPPGVRPDDLEIVSNSAGHGIRFVVQRQVLDGLPVVGTANFVTIFKGRISLIGVRSFAVPSTHSTLFADRAIPASVASETARLDLVGRGFKTEVVETSLGALPFVEDDTLVYKLVHVVGLSSPLVGSWTAYVDARQGSLLALVDNRRFVEGTMNLKHHIRNPNTDFTTSPGADLYVKLNNINHLTMADGSFKSSGPVETMTAELSGPHIDVNNRSGANMFFTPDVDAGVPDAGEYIWDSPDNVEFELSQLDAYAYTTIVRDKCVEITDGINWHNQSIEVNVNVEADLNGDSKPDYCNAWSDGPTINFLPAGGGNYKCNNTAMVSDILYHEYGHSVHMASVTAGIGPENFDGAVSEGFADTMSIVFTHDPEIGPYFSVSGSGIRNVEEDKVWPDDETEDVHATGLIVGGALWDLRKLFVEDLGEQAGHDLLDSLFAKAMMITGNVPSLYEATLLADDDNGDLNDGTPHFCRILDAYKPHGLTVSNVGRISIEHDQLVETVAPDKPISVEAEIQVGEVDCVEMGGARLVYSIDDAKTWTNVIMQSSGDTYSAEIPALSEGSEFFYRVEVDEDYSGDVIMRPDNAAEPFYRGYVGELEEIHCDDFESGDGEWTHELVAGEEREGADDWMRGTPTGKGGDPAEAFSGVAVWGNDLVPQPNWNGLYQANKIIALHSPAFDFSDYKHVRLRLRRWLTVEDGHFDQATIYVNDEPVWVNFGANPEDEKTQSRHHIDLEWVLFDLDISEFAAGKSDIQISFEIVSDGGLEMGGWNIDDFCFYGIEGVVEPPDTDAGATDADTDTDTDVDTDLDSGTSTDVDAGLPELESGGCNCNTTGRTNGAALTVFGTFLRLIF